MLLLTAALLGGAAPAPARAVKISGVLFDGVLKGSPEPDSAIRLENTDLRRSVDVGGFVLTESYTPKKRGGQRSQRAGSADEGMQQAVGSRGDGRGDGDGARNPRQVRLPDGTRIEPGGSLWIAASGKGFRQVFGYAPDLEAVDDDPAVQNASAPAGFLQLPAKHGSVALVDADGEVVDFVVYEVDKEGHYTESELLGLAWTGPPVRLWQSSFYGWKGQVLARDRDNAGRLVKDTDGAADWDSGFSYAGLGVDATHRVELAGQSRFVSTPLKVKAKVTATSAPDNNYQALIDALDGAKRELRVRIYQLTSHKVVEALLKAKARGVDVTVFLEGAPVGGIPDQERWLCDRMHKAGIGVYFLGGRPKQAQKPRYRFDHSKYVLVDDRLAIIGTENYGRTGVPVFPSHGNRGYMVHVENPAFVKQLRAVWDHDFKVGMADVIAIDESPTDAYGLPYRDPGFVPDEVLVRGQYENPAQPVTVSDTVGLELVLSPDTSLNERSSLLGLIGRAKKRLYIEQNSVRRRWGRKTDDAETAPNLALEAVVAAARRGVEVRVLVDSTWYNVQGDEDRDNDDTVSFLNELARTEKLNLSAKVINLQATHLEKIHAKGVIVDDQEVFVGSINWTENSFKGNREVGVIVSHPRIAGYYANLFRRDWAQSRIYTTTTTDKMLVRAAMSDQAPIQKRLGRGERVIVVAEHAGRQGRWLEVQLGLDVTGFVRPGAQSTPEAGPGEALHLVGRDAVVVGRVAATHVSDRRIQLRFGDAERPPFTAVLFKKNEGLFTAQGINPAQAFQGREVRLTGKVTSYRGPEIILDDPSQIEVLP